MTLFYAHKDENAIYYECGYSCDNAIFLCLDGQKYFITDSRYTIDASTHLSGVELVTSSNLLDEVISIIKKTKITTLTINPKEWSYFEVQKLVKIKIELAFDLLLSHKKRIIKSDEEIELLREAVRLGANGFADFAHEINENGLGKSEQELAFDNLACLSKRGSLATSFDAIVAINENAAKPHAHPSEKILRQNDLLLVDAGVKYKRYCSDRTRTVRIGDEVVFDYEQRFNDVKMQKVYDTVRKAHDEAIARYTAGMSAQNIDKLARDVIKEAGFGEYFTHSTGHGVGLDIHEFPYISMTSDTMIEENMVFTIEPGIYVDGFMGVRIEDMVVVKNGKLEVL